MKDFAKSIRVENESVENEYNPGSYDPNDHKWTLRKIDNEISRWRREVSYEKSRVADLERMVSSGDYGSLTNQELKEAKRALETAYMRLEQALSMKKRATGNSMVGNFEDPKKAEYYIKIWQYRKAEAERALTNAEQNLKELHKRKSPFGTDSFHTKDVRAAEEAKRAAEADVRKYSDLIKDAAKTTWGNQKVGNINKVSDAKGLYEDFRDAEKSGDTAKIERYKSKAKERIRDLKAKLKELQEDETDVSSAIQIYESF